MKNAARRWDNKQSPSVLYYNGGNIIIIIIISLKIKKTTKLVCVSGALLKLFFARWSYKSKHIFKTKKGEWESLRHCYEKYVSSDDPQTLSTGCYNRGIVFSFNQSLNC